MCKISDKIKFCTCVDENIDIEELDNYWILYRSSPQELQMVGLAMPPIMMTDISFLDSANSIEQRINSGDGFDQKLEFKEEDRLEIFLTIKEGEPWEFQYEFIEGRWEYEIGGFAPFSLNNDYEEIAQGKVEHVS